MQPASMLARLVADGTAMVAAANDLDAAVPSCPGWRVRDVLLHTGGVYAHKRTIVADDLPKPPENWPPENWPPENWPPAWCTDDPREWFDEQLHALVEALRTRDPLARCWTWYPPDQSVGFWVRRMMQETVIHRADVELAGGEPTPVDDDVAVDGIDELLVCFLAEDDEDYRTAAGSGERVAVAAGDRRWGVALDPDRARVVDGDDAATQITGRPSDVLLALWNRASYDVLDVSGDAGAIDLLRRALAAVTQ